jgi:hypothetical protein
MNQRRRDDPEHVRHLARISDRPYLAYRGTSCARCRCEPLWEAALSVHHRDQDRENNVPENLQTLCLTCHAEVHAQLRFQEDVA